MTISITSPITGGAQTGHATPAYTGVADTAPDISGKQFAITGVTGTVPGFRAHTVSDPCTVTIFRPKAVKVLQSANPVTGRYGAIPKNQYVCIVRKGVNYAANQAPEVAILRMTVDVPAGADAYDGNSCRILMGLAVGALNQQSAGFGDMLTNAII